ncbi:Protein of unknown function [Gryllus bimaculatus]|nr:Protein of unknown function [Gryllus bimaculatus]
MTRASGSATALGVDWMMLPWMTRGSGTDETQAGSPAKRMPRDGAASILLHQATQYNMHQAACACLTYAGSGLRYLSSDVSRHTATWTGTCPTGKASSSNKYRLESFRTASLLVYRSIFYLCTSFTSSPSSRQVLEQVGPAEHAVARLRVEAADGRGLGVQRGLDARHAGLRALLAARGRLRLQEVGRERQVERRARRRLRRVLQPAQLVRIAQQHAARAHREVVDDLHARQQAEAQEEPRDAAERHWRHTTEANAVAQ